MYACKTVLFNMIYSSIETTFASIDLTFGFDRMNSRSKQPWIELARYSPVIIEETPHFMVCTLTTFGGLIQKLNKIKYMRCSLKQEQVVKNQLFQQFEGHNNNNNIIKYFYSAIYIRMISSALQ